MKKVSELTDAELDYWVAKAEGRCLHKRTEDWAIEDGNDYESGVKCLDCRKEVSGNKKYSPSTDWSQGGQIIERERAIFADTGNGFVCGMGIKQRYGATHLIAAMRCYVASKFGEEVDDSQAHHD